MHRLAITLALNALVGCGTGADRRDGELSWSTCAIDQAAGAGAVGALQVTTQPLRVDANAGLATLGDRTAAFDLREGRLTLMSVAGDSEQLAFGSTGGGPGEFVPYGQSEYLRNYPVHWVDAQHDTIVAFDGRRLSRFNARGDYLDAHNVPLAVVSGLVKVSNVRLWRDTVLVGTYDTGIMPGRQRRLVVRAITRDTFRVVTEMLLSPLPKDSKGRAFGGLAEARPSWDLLGDCMIATDGHSDSLIVTEIASGRSATFAVPMPMRFQSGAERRETKLLGTDDYPLPTHPARVLTVVADPRGWIWMRPSEPARNLSPRIEVWRFHLPTRRLRIDTVPAFPLVWDSDGCSLGVGADANDEPQLIRMCSGT